MNAWGLPGREINQRSKIYDHAEPVEVGHVVFFTDCLAELERFYVEKLGFCVSDRYPNSAVFLRCSPKGGHHDMFLLQPPVPKRGLNHVAFTVRDIHEVFGGGLHISQCGWDDRAGPRTTPDLLRLFLVREESGRQRWSNTTPTRISSTRDGSRATSSSRPTSLPNGLLSAGSTEIHAVPRPFRNERLAQLSLSVPGKPEDGRQRRCAVKDPPAASCSSETKHIRRTNGRRCPRPFSQARPNPT